MVDVSHGMSSDSILERHVGDLGNIDLSLMIRNLTDDEGHTGRGESNTTG